MLAADLRAVREPAKIASVFPAAAKLRVVNVWAMWCAPCVAEMPDLRALDDAFGIEVAFAGVSLDDMLPDASQKPVRAFLDKHKIVYPNIYYTGNADALGDYLNFNGELPVTIVFDRSGKELWRHEGRINREQTIARLRDLLRRIR
ncbi:MAG TPA: TlpA disulfide reductase family protein [Thermoanaerobaculia bacterium]